MLRWTLLNLMTALVVLPCTMANAMDSSVNIKGKVVAAACSITSNLVSGQEVNLGSMPNINMQTAGQAGEWKSFVLLLNDCPPGTSKSTVTFTGVINTDDATLFANTEPTGTAAKKVGVQMAKDDDHSTILSNRSSMTVDVGIDQKAVFPLAARLYSTGQARAGKVSSTVLVNFTYQ